jgi:hypothetical protein
MAGGRTALQERDAARFSNLGGFTSLVVHGVAFMAATVASYVLEVEIAALVYLFVGIVAFPLSLVAERMQGFRMLGSENQLTPLFIQVASIQIVALPAVIYVYDFDPLIVPAALAAVAGAHFLPYTWLQGTPIYGALAVFTALAPWGLLIAFSRETAFHITGFVVGAGLVAAGLGVRLVVTRARAAAAGG